MGWKGTVRSIGAIARQVERESQRQHREYLKRQKEYEKQLELERAENEVEEHNCYINSLLSVHKTCSPLYDWEGIKSSVSPQKPEKIEQNTIAAKKAYLDYKPSIFDKAFCRTESKRNKLTDNAKKAQEKDLQIYLRAVENFKKESFLYKLSGKVLSGDLDSYILAIKNLNPFSNISELGTNINFHVDHKDYIEATLHVNGEDVIPEESKSLLKTGRVSTKKMSQTKFHEIYQDYVCSCVLRIARELFSLLPIRVAVVTAEAKILNLENGHLEEKPILTVVIPREEIIEFNFERIDPSDSMNVFVHKMAFNKTKGFKAIEKFVKKDIENLLDKLRLVHK